MNPVGLPVLGRHSHAHVRSVLLSFYFGSLSFRLCKCPPDGSQDRRMHSHHLLGNIFFANPDFLDVG